MNMMLDGRWCAHDGHRDTARRAGSISTDDISLPALFRFHTRPFHTVAAGAIGYLGLTRYALLTPCSRRDTHGTPAFSPRP